MTKIHPLGGKFRWFFGHSSFTRQCSNICQVWWNVYIVLIANFPESGSVRIFKIGKKLTKLQPKFDSLLFLEHGVHLQPQGLGQPSLRFNVLCSNHFNSYHFTIAQQRNQLPVPEKCSPHYFVSSWCQGDSRPQQRANQSIMYVQHSRKEKQSFWWSPFAFFIKQSPLRWWVACVLRLLAWACF